MIIEDALGDGEQWIPEAALDLIRYTVMTDPVLAEDDHTYERASIEAWFAACRAQRQPLTSPLTRATIGDSLRPNWNAQNLLTELQERRAAARKASAELRAQVDGGGGGAPVGLDPDDGPPGARTVQGMAKVFKAIDPLRDLFASMDWKPPRACHADGEWLACGLLQIIVLGNEKAGKSSTLERLANMPVFPKDTALCTRMAIELRLRRQPATLPMIQVLDISGAQERILKEVTIPMETSGTYVNEEMRAIIARETGREFSKDRMLRIIINSPEVCSLDLVDTPGLLAAAHQPANIKVVREIVERQIELSPHALFLVIIPGNQSITDSLALNVIREKKLEAATMAVITRADVCDRDMYGNPTGFAQLQPLLQTLERDYRLGHGAVMLSNKEVQGASSHYDRLHQMAVNEAALFASDAFKTMQGRVSISAAMDRLSQILNNYVRDTWVPMTLLRLLLETQALQTRDKQLGLPRAHEQEITVEDRRVLMEAARSAVHRELTTQHDAIFAPFVAGLQDLTARLSRAGSFNASSPTMSFALYRTQLAALRTEAYCCIDDWCRGFAPTIAAQVVSILQADASAFKIGRFPTLVTAIQTRILEGLAAHQPLLLDRMHKRIDRFLDDPTTAHFRVEYHEYQGGDQVKVAYSGKALADAVVEAIITSAVLDVPAEVAAQDAAALPGVEWLEGCCSDRKEILARLALIESAQQHIMATLDISKQQSNIILQTAIKAWQQASNEIRRTLAELAAASKELAVGDGLLGGMGEKLSEAETALTRAKESVETLVRAINEFNGLQHTGNGGHNGFGGRQGSSSGSGMTAQEFYQSQGRLPQAQQEQRAAQTSLSQLYVQEEALLKRTDLTRLSLKVVALQATLAELRGRGGWYTSVMQELPEPEVHQVVNGQPRRRLHPELSTSRAPAGRPFGR